MTKENFIKTSVSINPGCLNGKIEIIDNGNGQKIAIASSQSTYNNNPAPEYQCKPSTARIEDSCALAGIMYDANRYMTEYNLAVGLLKELTNMMVLDGKDGAKPVIIQYDEFFKAYKGLMWNYFTLDRVPTRGDFISIIKLLEIHKFMAEATGLSYVTIICKDSTTDTWIDGSGTGLCLYIAKRDLYNMIECNSHEKFLESLNNFSEYSIAKKDGAICEKKSEPNVVVKKKIKYKKPEILEDAPKQTKESKEFKLGSLFNKDFDVVLNGGIKISSEITKPDGTTSEKHDIDLNEVKISIKF